MQHRAWGLAFALSILLGLFLVAGAPARAQEPTARLALVGDIMLGREIGRAIATHGAAYPLDALRPYLAGADVACGNLESPLTTAARVAGAYDLHALPAYGDILARLGFDVVSLANNHATDHGREGLAETMRTLTGLGVAWVGAGRDRTTAHAPMIREVKGLRIAFLAYEGLGATLPAGADEAGVVWLEPATAAAEIAAARRQADLVVVNVHWGVEYESTPTAQQKALAAQMADAGADLIIGHHPHVVQPVEWLAGKGQAHRTLVAYSLGNFVFDMGMQPEVLQAAILHCEVGPAGVLGFGLQTIQMRPWQMGPADAANGRAVLGRLLPDTRQPLWQTVEPGPDGRAPTVWELEPAALGRARPAPDATARAGLPAQTTGAALLDDGRLVALWQMPPAWLGESAGVAGWNRRAGSRLAVYAPDGAGWRAVGRAWPLAEAGADLACRAAGAAIECALLDGARRAVGWRWDGARWRKMWEAPVGGAGALLWWDADSDGQPDVLAQGSHER